MSRKKMKNWLQVVYHDRQKRCSYFQEMLDNSLWWHYITLLSQWWDGVDIFLINQEKNLPINSAENFIEIVKLSENSCQWCCKTIELSKQYRIDDNHYCFFCYLKHKIQDVKRKLFWVYCDVQNYVTKNFIY